MANRIVDVVRVEFFELGEPAFLASSLDSFPNVVNCW